MKIEISDINTARKRVEITVPSEEVNQRLEKAFKEVSKTAKLDGFRKGKIPRNVLEKYFGTYIREQATHDMIKELMSKALDDAKIQPVVPPVVQPGQIKKDEDFVFSAEVEVLPPIAKVDYEGIEVEVPFTDVTEEAVDLGMENMRLRFATVKKPDPPRPVVKGDHLSVDFDARSDDGPIGSEKNVGLEVGLNTMPAEFEEGLVGMNEGEQKTITVSYSKDAGISLAGKSVTFDVVVKEIKERILPELDDEFAKDVGMQNLSDLRDHLKKRIVERGEMEKKEVARREIMKKIREKNPIDLPPTLVDQQRKMIIEETKQRFASMKLPFREDQFGEEFLEKARERVQDDILLQVIADAQSMKVSDEDMNAHIEEWAQEIGHAPDKLKAALKAENRLEPIRYRLRQDKTLDFLMTSAIIKYVNKKDLKSDNNVSKSVSEEEKSKRGES